MKLAYFPNQIALNAKPVIDAVLAGCQRLNIETVANSVDADLAVIWSVLWHGRMKANQRIWEIYRSTNRPVLVVEVGMLNRGVTWKVGLNGTGSGAYYGEEFDCSRVQQLGLTVMPWTNTGSRVVIALQRSDSEQWSGQPSIEQWLDQTISTLRQYTDRPIVVRPHPRQKIKIKSEYIIEPAQKIPGTYDSYDYQRSLSHNTWAVINWNSGPGCQAILQGIPAFVGSSSLAASVANLDLTQIENPVRPDRSQWLTKLAHTEWTVDEIASGVALERLLCAVPGYTFVNPGQN